MPQSAPMTDVRPPEIVSDEQPTDRLARTVSLPLLVFYGLGVTVGAGIFALVGEILAVSGGLAPVAFATSALIAGTTAWTYSYFVRLYPRAGGEAVYVTAGLGRRFGTVTGLLVIIAGTVSSAVVALAFGGYLSDAFGVPTRVGAIVVLGLVAVVACRGIRESVMAAAAVTIIEVGALVVIIFLGVPDLVTDGAISHFTEAPDGTRLGVIASGAILAFFAFIGFEDIANLAEETQNPERNAPRAIAWTLGVSLALYVLVSAIAVVLPDRDAIVDSEAPMARVFEAVSGLDGRPVAIIATLAMTNGILIQMIMAARVAFGLAAEGLIPRAFGGLARVHPRWKTPVTATLVVAAVVAVLVVSAPLADLARWTSLVILTIFTLVNASLLRLGRDHHPPRSVVFTAVAGGIASAGLACWELAGMLGA